MTPIEIKVIKHTLEVLRMHDTYPTYSILTDEMAKAKINQTDQAKILTEYQESVAEQTKKINTAKDWLETLLLENK